jgi:hypothetical protein
MPALTGSPPVQVTNLCICHRKASPLTANIADARSIGGCELNTRENPTVVPGSMSLVGPWNDSILYRPDTLRLPNGERQFDEHFWLPSLEAFRTFAAICPRGVFAAVTANPMVAGGLR